MLRFMVFFAIFALTLHEIDCSGETCATPLLSEFESPRTISQRHHRSFFARAAVQYKPMRIRIFKTKSFTALDLESQQILMAGINMSVDFFQTLLSVVQLDEELQVINEINDTLRMCWHYVGIDNLSEEALGEHKITNDAAYVENVDIAIYLRFKMEGDEYCATDIQGYAMSCSKDDDGRPVVGFVTLCPPALAMSSTQELFNLLRHEMLHVFGVAGDFFIFPSLSKHEQTVEWKVTDEYTSQRRFNIIASDYPNTLAAIRHHFNCSSLAGLPIENGGRMASQNAHWDQQMFGNEIMSPKQISSEDFFSNITAMYLSELRNNSDDRPLYKVNFSLIQSDIDSYWFGRNLGCTFVMKSCRAFIEEQIDKHQHQQLLTPAFPLCTPDNALEQTFDVCCDDLKVTARCYTNHRILNDTVYDANSQLIPREQWLKEYGYFEDTPAKGFYGFHDFGDYCPYMMLWNMTLSSGCSGGFHSCEVEEATVSTTRKPSLSSTTRTTSTSTCSSSSFPRDSKIHLLFVFLFVSV